MGRIRSAEEPTLSQLSLRALPAGEMGRVTALRDAGASVRRLAEFGLVPGATVQMIRAGAPCIVRVDHTRLSLGAALQEGVLLSPLD